MFTFAHLNEKAAVGHLHLLLGPVSGPHEQPWVARLAVNCQEVQVVVIPSDDAVSVAY
jgi:hypothetical protein